MRENLILLSLILFLSSNYPLNSYDNNIRGKAVSEHYELKGGHYDYHYKNDKLHKKFNKASPRLFILVVILTKINSQCVSINLENNTIK